MAGRDQMSPGNYTQKQPIMTRTLNGLTTIGTAKQNQIDYTKDEAFFMPHKNVPLSVRQICFRTGFQIRNTAKKVQDSISPDILGLKAKPWDAQVSYEKGQRAQSLHHQALVDVILSYCVLKEIDPLRVERREFDLN